MKSISAIKTLILVAACAILWRQAASRAAAAAARVVLVLRGQRLSVDGAGAPIGLLLGQVARCTGIAVEGAGILTGKSHARFANVPLAQGLARLLPGVNFALVEPPRSGTGRCPMTLVVLDNPSLRPGQDGAPPRAVEVGDGGEPDPRFEQVYEAAQSGDLEILKRAATGRNSDTTQAVALDLLAQRDPRTAADLELGASVFRPL